jgi:hypothetical protein
MFWKDTAGHVQAFLTPTHLAIAMEYAPGGELFNYLAHERRFSENKVCHHGQMYAWWQAEAHPLKFLWDSKCSRVVWAVRPHVLCVQARYFFQQLLAGLEYCHTKVCCPAHRRPSAAVDCCMLLSLGRAKNGCDAEYEARKAHVLSAYSVKQHSFTQY